MPIDHTNCTHPRTPAGRRACRAGRVDRVNPLVKVSTPAPRVSRETPVKEYVHTPFPVPAHLAAGEPSWLSTEGVIRNGGIRPPGTEDMLASTGSNKNKRREIKKATVDGGVDHDEAGNAIHHASRSGLPVVNAGLYRHPDGTRYVVKIGRESRKPFAVTESGEYAKGIIFELRATDRVDEKVVEVPGLNITVPVKPVELELGFYEMNGQIYRVKRSRSTSFLYAMHITDECPRGERAPGIVKQLTPEMKLTAETAAEYGKRTGNCCVCGRELTKDESIERGIGRVCYGKMGW